MKSDLNVSLVLSSGNMNYLNAENGPLEVIVNDAPVTLPGQAPDIENAVSESSDDLLLNYQANSTDAYSGDLLQDGALLTQAKNQFVQVATRSSLGQSSLGHSAIGLITGSGSSQKKENLVSTTSAISYTSAMPTITTNFSDMPVLNNEELAVQKLVVQNDQLPLGVVPVAAIVQEVSPLNKVPTGITTTPFTYVWHMTVEQDNCQPTTQLGVKKTGVEDESFTLKEPQ